MPLSELKDRAIRFAQDWQTATDERADAQAFWIDFLHVFDVKRRRVASFGVPIKKVDGRQGFIDLLLKGTLLVEHKSRGHDLDRAGPTAPTWARAWPSGFPSSTSRRPSASATCPTTWPNCPT